MKVVINACFGGFSLSPRAMKRMAELQGRECYFFTDPSFNGAYVPASMEEARYSMFAAAFDIPNPSEVLPDNSRWHEMTDEERIASNAVYSKHSIESRPENRADPLLVQVVEELGEAANGSYASLRVVEIPDGVEWEIDEYDGAEHVAEKHRTWR